MNLDDETILSSYLDDELDPADRLVVEWAVESSPPLGEQLRALATARDAVAGLARPRPPRDFSFAVVAEIAAARRPGRRAILVRSGRLVAAVAGVSAMAASLLIALVLLHHSTHGNGVASLSALIHPAPAPGRTHIATLPLAPVTPPSPPLVAAKSAPAVVVASSIATATARAEPPSALPAAAIPPDGAREPERRRAVAEMMGRRRVLRALIVTDVVDASDRVKSLIERDPRKSPEFGRIAIYQGIVVDPDNPEAADVFSVALDERGCRPFLDRLRREFPGLRVDGDVGPELLTQLPEVGQVALFPGTGAAELGAPPAEVRPFIAAKDTPSRHIDGVEDAGPAPAGDDALVVKFAGESPARRERDGGDPAPSPTPPEPVTVLVWVTHPHRR